MRIRAQTQKGKKILDYHRAKKRNDIMGEFIIISKYKNTSDLDFGRGTFDVTIYQHKMLLLVCEIRKYYDCIICISHSFFDGQQVYATSLVPGDFPEQSSIDIKNQLLADSVYRLVKKLGG